MTKISLIITESIRKFSSRNNIGCLSMHSYATLVSVSETFTSLQHLQNEPQSPSEEVSGGVDRLSPRPEGGRKFYSVIATTS